ncbi:MAG: methionine synthase [Chitinivibrionales bacterium]|nr:methionine synthase [Chitinivibrionales bacterium]MBD3358432.1 methionine synthase [Chitinivibrionales bacterium]
MKRITERLSDNHVLISDGAWGTFLQNKGLGAGDCPELWCLERRDDVFDIAKSYIDAGADMIEANSFGANRFKLEHYGLADRVAQINEAAAAISREAAGPDRHVIASVGPTGKMLVMGDVTEEQLYEAFTEQIGALEKGGADAVCIETMSAVDEACCAIKAAKENTKLEVICTFTFEKTVNGGYRTMMGVSPTDMAEAVLNAGADIIGSNCGNGIERMIDIVKELRGTAPSAPILVHANAGAPRVVDGATVFPETPEDMAAQVPALTTAGAKILGGCCGTTPQHIVAMKAAVDGMN